MDFTPPELDGLAVGRIIAAGFILPAGARAITSLRRRIALAAIDAALKGTRAGVPGRQISADFVAESIGDPARLAPDRLTLARRMRLETMMAESTRVIAAAVSEARADRPALRRSEVRGAASELR